MNLLTGFIKQILASPTLREQILLDFISYRHSQKCTQFGHLSMVKLDDCRDCLFELKEKIDKAKSG